MTGEGAASAPEGAVERMQDRAVVVDDEPAIRRLVVRALERAVAEVVEASDGRGAIAAVEADPAGLAILVCDLTLPDVGGDRVVRAARALRPDLPVVVMTGWDPASVAGALGDAGPVIVLAKPFTLADVRAAVSAALPR